jgi:3-oxoacyl-[acyl-carrier protein] reductase
LKSLSGKTALVTGASRGIGRASALALGKAGAQVLVHYARAEKEADAVAAEIRNLGGRAEKLAADLAAKDGPHQLARQVRAIVGERLDILVANAGISGPSPIEQTTVDDFDKLYALNVRAPYFLVQQLLPIMCQDSSVTLLSSLAVRISPRGGQSLGVRDDQGCRRYDDEALRNGARLEGYSGQRRCAWRGRN